MVEMVCPSCSSKLFTIGWKGDKIIPVGPVKVTCGTCSSHWEGTLILEEGTLKWDIKED